MALSVSWDLCDEREVANTLRQTVDTLRRNRWRGIGPAYIKVSRRIFYRPADVEAWLEAHRVEPEAAS